VFLFFFLTFFFKIFGNVVNVHLLCNMNGQELKELRLKAGLTQEELAKKTRYIQTKNFKLGKWCNEYIKALYTFDKRSI
jgi:hypothetical protein